MNTHSQRTRNIATLVRTWGFRSAASWRPGVRPPFYGRLAAAILCVVSVVPGLNSRLRAQDVEVQVATEEPPHYVGVGAIVQLTIDGLEPKPEPECTAESPSPDVRVRLSGISPRIMQRIIQSGNQIRRVQQVTFTVQFRVTADNPGEYEIGPFVIKQGATEKRIDAIKMSFAEVPTTDDMRVELLMPATAYPDQRVPVTLQWWFAGDVQRINQLDIDGTVFDELQFAPDPPAQRGRQTLPIQTGQGTVSLPATVTNETVDDKEFTVISAERTLIPNRPGTFEISPVTATIELVTQWEQRRQSPFGDFGFGGSLLEEAFGSRRRPAKVELFRARSEPWTFEVKPFPSDGRPESFTGAVGKGFSIDASADRTVVRVGDPIRLKLNLRGDGNIAGATLPPLSADGGLDPARFRLPEGDVPGMLTEDDDAKEFIVSVRVLDESVNEIPAIAYSWFDAEKETYLTARSKPIALRVMPAQVVGADSVVSNQTRSAEPRTSSAGQGPATESNDQSRTYSLSGADLAIQRDVDQLMRGKTRLLAAGSFQVAVYALGSLCIVVAWVDRKRRSVDPAVRHADHVLRQQRSRVVAAEKLSEKEAAKQVADALRTVIAEMPDIDRTVSQSLIAQCETIVYKPSGDSQSRIDGDLVRQALSAIDQARIESGA